MVRSKDQRPIIPMVNTFTEDVNNRPDRGMTVLAGWLSLVGLFVVPGVIMTLIFDQNPHLDITGSLVLMAFSEALVIALAWALSYKQFGFEFKGKLRGFFATLGFRNFNWRQLVAGVGVAFALIMLLQFFANIMASMGFTPESSDTSEKIISSSGLSFLVTAVLLSPIVIPVLEELLFRGVAAQFLSKAFKKKSWGVAFGVVISSIAFAFAHSQGFSTLGDFMAIVFPGLLGLISAIGFFKTDSIYFSLALHIGYNGISIIMATM